MKPKIGGGNTINNNTMPAKGLNANRRGGGSGGSRGGATGGRKKQSKYANETGFKRIEASENDDSNNQTNSVKKLRPGPPKSGNKTLTPIEQSNIEQSEEITTNIQQKEQPQMSLLNDSKSKQFAEMSQDAQQVIKIYMGVFIFFVFVFGFHVLFFFFLLSFVLFFMEKKSMKKVKI